MKNREEMEEELLHPDKWYVNLLTKQVTQSPGQDRLGPYKTKEEAEHAFALAKERNSQWQADDDEWNGKMPDEKD
ncbi:MAG: hypothetical protein QG671_1847 [Actinomycetota bacterium]|nr:hypothetical protein [Actinomycetota bacterium]HQZ85667.1 hypothetical protein [Actinomycetota bacterium]